MLTFVFLWLGMYYEIRGDMKTLFLEGDSMQRMLSLFRSCVDDYEMIQENDRIAVITKLFIYFEIEAIHISIPRSNDMTGAQPVRLRIFSVFRSLRSGSELRYPSNLIVGSGNPIFRAIL